MRGSILLSLLLAVAPFQSIGAQSHPTDTSSIAIDRIFDRWRGTTGPGCAVGAARNGQILAERAYGMANLETGTPNTPRTVFHAASLAKQVTAMAVMLLVRDGKFSLDEDVRRLLPELPDYGRVITARHLLTHTSGLRDYIELLILQRGRFEEDRITRADLIDIVGRQRSLNFAPGTEFSYSNTGYALLALLVERVSGRPLRDFAAERIFLPLGLTSTRFQDDVTSLVPGRAWGYASRDGDWHSSMPNYDVSGPTNLLTTVGDLLIWLDNLDRPRVGDSAIVRQMTTNAVLANGDTASYGFGLGLTRFWGPPVQEHEGSDPGFRAYSGHYPDQHLAIAVLCNTRSANAVGLGHDVAAVYLGDIHRPTPPYTVAPAEPVDSLAGAVRAGVYFEPAGVEVVEFSWRNGALYTARQGGRRLVPLGRHRFQVEGVPVIHTFGADPHSGFVARSLEPGHHNPVAFEWRAPARMTPESLTAYTGEYFSLELNATYRISADDSTLILRTGSAPAMTFRPAFQDAFTDGQLVVQFTRRGNHVTGLQLSHPRALRVAFVRAGR
jgi:CubicO group peptidase (beta-lactamase class C family)